MNEASSNNLKINQLPVSFWVKDDSRSVIAMLKGTGDGRHFIYIIFLLCLRYVEPISSFELAASRYKDLLQRSPRLQNFDEDRRRFGPLAAFFYGLTLAYKILEGK